MRRICTPYCVCPQVRTAVTKSGCKMADSGSVLFNFERQGLLFVPAGISEDEVSLTVLRVLASLPVYDVLPCVSKHLGSAYIYYT